MIALRAAAPRRRCPIKTIQEATGCTLHEALDLFAQRYEELRRDRPADFQLSREEYGQGFYS
ncbi:hypothetical protein FNJ62_08720 [Streptomyces benahoarensis]|uniref:Uncharacterized protein n=1 Tax=Streptomyces benahoarensis TaxID=2595054 RepID=A0A553ZPN2_9ACTN|nr:hypothetical protein FNJ62_08720 [Streptomyces benahoarensis]TSB43428.1 hypothetical protein FNZ23_04560 [Streptomyces benahoarensis]